MPRKKSGAKRRGHGEGSGGWRRDGRYCWRISLPDGQRKSFYGSSKDEAVEKATRALRDIEAGIDLSSGNPPLREFLRMWLDDVAANRVRASTLRSYRGHIEHHIVPALGKTRIRDLKAQQVVDLLASVAKATSGKTANRVRATLRTALATAVKWGMVERNAAALADPRREQPHRITPLTHEEVLRLLDATILHRYGPLFAVAVTTGLRQGELLALRWGPDIDLVHGILTVHHSLISHQGKVPGETAEQRRERLARQRVERLGPPKTPQSQRTIRLSRIALSALERQRQQIEVWRLKAAGRWVELDLVFPTQIGTFADGPTVTRSLQRMLEEAGLPRQRFHDLRHATASLQLGEGADLFAVKELLGHSQIALTANTYGHMTRKLSDDTAHRMDRALDTKTDTKTASNSGTG